MPIEIKGVKYFTSADVCKELRMARQTLWRWRHQKKVPSGRRYRDYLVLFTEDEVAAIREYAHRLEPAEAFASNQLKLFSSTRQNG